jgi:hypothetical protein
MPAKKMQKNNRRKTRSSGAMLNPFGTKPLFPPTRRVALAYSERVAMTEAAGGVGITYAFSLNSLFDPNATGVGAQPVGFDEISAMYGQYRVWKARVKLTFMNATTNVSSIVGAFATYQPTAPADPNAWLCQPFCKSGRIEALGSVSSTVLTMDVDIPSVLGLTKQQYDSDMDYVGTPSGSPTRQAYLMLFLRGFGNTTAGSGVCFVQIEYLTQFSRPIALNVS